MSHADNILLQSPSFDKTSVTTKFLGLIDDILAEFRKEKLDEVFAGVAKSVPHEDKLGIDKLGNSSGLIDSAIKEKCRLLEDPKQAVEADAKDNAPKMLNRLSLSEQFYILAHINLNLLKHPPENPNPVFASLVYYMIRHCLLG